MEEDAPQQERMFLQTSILIIIIIISISIQ
jgi:hypothetical protein